VRPAPGEASGSAIERKKAVAFLAAGLNDDVRAYDERRGAEAVGRRRRRKLRNEIVAPALFSGLGIDSNQMAVRPDGEHVAAVDRRCRDRTIMRAVVPAIRRTDRRVPGLPTGERIECDNVVDAVAKLHRDDGVTADRDFRITAVALAPPQFLDPSRALGQSRRGGGRIPRRSPEPGPGGAVSDLR
jgi:hypothetical protein